MTPTAHALIPPLSFKHFLIQGLFGCLVGVLTGFLNALLLIIVLLDKLGPGRLLDIALFALGGIIAGAIQGGFLRHTTRPTLLWLLLSAIGWSIVGFVDTQGAIPKSAPGEGLVVSLLYGGLAALAQWLLLRRSLPFAACWLPVSASAWGILGLMLQLAV